MIQRLSDEEITELANKNQFIVGYDEDYTLGYEECQNRLFPELEKLEELNQANIRALRTQAKEIEKLQGEIADLKFKLQYALSPFQGFVAIDKYEQLTAKHERLVKGLKDIQNIPISLNSGYVRYVIESIITESEGE